MDLKEVALTAGKAALGVFPWGGAVVEIADQLLPGDKKVTEETTGEELEGMIDSLPAQEKAAVLARKLDVQRDISSNNRDVKVAMAKADASGNSKRPLIAMAMAGALGLIVLMVVLAYVVVAFRTGELPDPGVLIRVMDVINGVLTEYFNSTTT